MPDSPAAPVSRPHPFLQRLLRGIDGLLAPHRAIDDSPARALLPQEALPLYGRMSKVDRAHSLRLLAWLQAQGWRDPDLLAAALLHDSGKSAAPIAVWHRTLKVLLRRLAPGRWAMLSRPAQPGTWRYPFYILRTHPFRGAYAAREAGLSPITAWLIEYHESDPDPTHPHYPLMRALQDGDAAS